MKYLILSLVIFIEVIQSKCDPTVSLYDQYDHHLPFKIRDTGELLFDPRINIDFIPGDNVIFNAITAALPFSLLNFTLPANVLDALGANPLALLRDVYPMPKGRHEPYDEYDYVIVGAGSTGSVLAARLSEDGKDSVLLLEQGKPESVLTDVPMLKAFLTFTDYTEAYFLEPSNSSCLGMLERRCVIPRGRAVGGNSVTNLMMYLRALPDELNKMAADGNYGWSYDEILPYFIRSESAYLKDEIGSKIHGVEGELNVEETRFRTILAAPMLAALALKGHILEDYNKGRGFSYTQSTLRNGRRCSSAKAFLHPNRFRPNLHVLPEAKALKVDINYDNDAESVHYVWQSKKRTVKARKEIIITAGPIASPQLLMLSGIGPKDHLETFGIKVVKDLQVGQTLYDRTIYPMQFTIINKKGASFVSENTFNLQNLGRYLLHNEGPLTAALATEVVGYITTSIGEQDDTPNDIKYVLYAGTVLSDGGLMYSRMYNIDPNYFLTLAGDELFAESYTLATHLVQPKSKGYIRLRSSDPNSQPLVFGNYLTNTSDVKAFIEGIRYSNKLVLSEPLTYFHPRLVKVKFPNCPDLVYDSDEYWECAIRSVVGSDRQPISTCKMGPSDDPDAVVDPELKVYGIKNLRVAGNCAIPRPVSGTSHATSIAIGEKAADMIKATWHQRDSEKLQYYDYDAAN